MNDSSCLCPTHCAIADFSVAVNVIMTGLHSLHWSHLVLFHGEKLGVFCAIPLFLLLPQQPGFRGISVQVPS